MSFPAWRPAALIAASLALASPSLAAADKKPDPINPDRPGIADGSTVVGPGVFQIEVGVQRENRSAGPADDRRLFAPTLLRYGLSDRWEARFETNGYSHVRSFTPAAGVQRADGLSPVSFGAKYHFQDPGEKNGRLSLGAILRVFPATGSAGFQTEHAAGDLRLAADWQFDKDWALNPNVGIALYEDDAGRTFGAGLAAVTLIYGPTHRFQPWIDAGFQAPEARSGGRTAVIVDGGAMYLLGRDTQVDFGIGAGVSGRTPPDLFWTVGISQRFR